MLDSDDESLYLNNIYLDTTTNNTNNTYTISSDGILSITISPNYSIYADTAITYTYDYNMFDVENILDRMELKDIEQYLRKKKLKNLKRDESQM